MLVRRQLPGAAESVGPSLSQLRCSWSDHASLRILNDSILREFRPFLLLLLSLLLRLLLSLLLLLLLLRLLLQKHILL